MINLSQTECLEGEEKVMNKTLKCGSMMMCTRTVACADLGVSFSGISQCV
ncbi:MAG: hypothetical protein II713_05540 [Clostridia bacterium]|nr:hypothetical protein [Clostridia bacterium]